MRSKPFSWSIILFMVSFDLISHALEELWLILEASASPLCGSVTHIHTPHPPMRCDMKRWQSHRGCINISVRMWYYQEENSILICSSDMSILLLHHTKQYNLWLLYMQQLTYILIFTIFHLAYALQQHIVYVMSLIFNIREAWQMSWNYCCAYLVWCWVVIFLWILPCVIWHIQ